MEFFFFNSNFIVHLIFNFLITNVLMYLAKSLSNVFPFKKLINFDLPNKIINTFINYTNISFSTWLVFIVSYLFGLINSWGGFRYIFDYFIILIGIIILSNGINLTSVPFLNFFKLAFDKYIVLIPIFLLLPYLSDSSKKRTKGMGISDITGSQLLIILVIVLLLFGSKKIPDLAKSVGKCMKEFKTNLTPEQNILT
jgi:TatA/E family protein of Tat protein translocase